MFKETLLLFTIALCLCFVLRLLLDKKPHFFCLITILVLISTVAINIVYNIQAFLPEFVLDDQVPLGDCKENLFLYKADSQYPCEIIFPLLQDRDICIDSSSTYYDLFLETFSNKTSKISLSDQEREAVISETSFSKITPFPLIELMNYAFKESYTFKELPTLYIQTNSLSHDDTLIALIDENCNLYLMSKTYFSFLIQALPNT